MNAEITRIRTKLNTAIYIMIDADSDKRYNTAARNVQELRLQLREAMRDYLDPEPERDCGYCGDTLQSFEFDICTHCMNEEIDEGSYCDVCGSETEEQGADYCNVCWDDVMKQDEEEAA